MKSMGIASLFHHPAMNRATAEMQNQDPTANTDPNEYVNQLVNVNSLEQLISINQTLSTAVGSSGSGGTGTASGGIVGATGTGQITSNASTQAVLSAPHVGAHVAEPTNELIQVSGSQAPGNLSIPGANPAATRVAQALGGWTKSKQ
jgi:flagellar basal-body rod modification protein FlgD